jgi:hypothetical protein
MTRIGKRVGAAALCILTAGALSTCSTGLLDLLAFQVLSNETAMLYLGYEEAAGKGFGVARLGLTSGVLETFRLTVSTDNVNGCPVCIDPRPISADFAWPRIYYGAESPNRILSTEYNALGTPLEELQTGVTDQTNCVRFLLNQLGYAAIYWSTPSHSPVSTAGIFYLVSFDVDPTTYRIYYLGLPLSGPQETNFGVIGVNSNGSVETDLVVLGHYNSSNLLLQNGYLYYVTQDPMALCRIKADGSEPAPTTLLTPTATPQAIAVDPEDGTLYWIELDENTPRRIMRAAAGETAGVPIRENLGKIDPNGFFFYRP